MQTTVNGRSANYFANLLNQYGQRDVPGAVDILGIANAAATVSVNDERAKRQGGFFYKELEADNSALPILVSATTIGVLNRTGTSDLVSTVTGCYAPNSGHKKGRIVIVEVFGDLPSWRHRKWPNNRALVVNGRIGIVEVVI